MLFKHGFHRSLHLILHLENSPTTVMNVGFARLDIVNTSQPQLVHTTSPQPLATLEHSSSSDYASEASSVEQRNRAVQYETPPSRPQSSISYKPAESEMTLPVRPSAARPAPPNLRRNEPSQNPIPDADLYRQIYDMSPPTPGVDESPYIRFAIEQLTRDEELLGQGRHGSISSADYPVERFISDEGLGYYTPAIPKPQAPTVKQANTPMPKTIPRDAARRSADDLFVPIERPEDFQYPPLGYLPVMLRLPAILLFIFTCLLMITGLIFCNVWSLRYDGLYAYDGTGTARYFVFQFLSQMLGMIIVFWILILQAAVYRIIPFVSMSSRRDLDRVLQGMSILPANFAIPDVRHVQWGEPLVGICLLVFWMSYFSVPLLGCMFQTELYDIDGKSQWRWTSVQAVVWVLVVIYLLLIAAAMLLLFRFRKSRSALLWDPVCLADLMALFQKTNIIADYDRSEIAESTRAQIPAKQLRLGYWTIIGGAEAFHSIGQENASARRFSKEMGFLDEKRLSGYDSPSFGAEYQRYSHAESFTRNLHSPFVRYRWIPWFLGDSLVVAWIVAALILYLAFLIVSFVNGAVSRGFFPRLETLTNSHGFSPSNFLFSFLPALLGMFLFLAWQHIDVYFRAVQPLANMASHPDGATAKRSLLLAYPAAYPGQVTALALANRDYKVAWLSFVSLLSATLPILAGGIFTGQFFDQREVRIAATLPAYYALCVILGVYAFSFLVIWPKRKRYLPHELGSVADHLSFVYMSPLLREPAFDQPRSKRDLVGRLCAYEERYVFGVYVGRDGKEHLGVDRVGGNGSNGGSNGNDFSIDGGNGSRRRDAVGLEPGREQEMQV